MNPDHVPGPAPDERGADPVKTALMARYRTSFVGKLNRRDLEELQFLLKNKFSEERAINPEYLDRFMFRLREYFSEEVLTKEMAGIEALVSLLRPGDLSDRES